MSSKSFAMPLLFAVLFSVWMVLTFSGALAPFDEAGLLMFRDESLAPVGGQTMVAVMTGVTHLGDSITAIVAAVLAIGYVLLRGARKLAVWGSLALVGLFLLSPLLKLLVGRARPDIVEHLVHASTNSFPSGHAIRSFGIYLLIFMILRGFLPLHLRVPAVVGVLLVALATGISRVYLGVHWPTDVIASWLVTFTWVTIWQEKLSYKKDVV